MVLFSISCETCASRLNVRQQAAIGQVLACPKCGSMVHVQPPEGWKSPEAEAPPRKPPPPRDPADSQATLSNEFDDFDGVGDAQSRKPIPATPRVVRQRTRQNESANEDAETASPPVQQTVVIPDGNWTPESARQRGKVTAWIAGVLGISLVAVVLILYLVSRMMNGDEPGDSQQHAKANQTGNSAVSTAPDPDEIDPLPVDRNSDDNSKPENTDPDALPQNEDPNVNSNDANQGDDKTTDNGQPGNQRSAESDTDNNVPDLDVDAALQDNPGVSVEDDNTSVLDEFEGIGELVFDPGIDFDEFLDAKVDAQSRAYGIGKVFVPKPDPLSVDPESAINEIYPGLSYKDQTLLEFVRNFTGLTQVPTLLDGEAITNGLIDPHRKIEALVQDAPVIELLQAAIEPLDLEWRWNDLHTAIIVTPVGSDFLLQSEIEPDPVLITDDKLAQDLIEVVQRTIQPDSWNTGGGVGTIEYKDGKFVIEQTGHIGKQVESLFSKLTIAARLKDDPGNVALNEELATLYSRSHDLLNSTSTYQSTQLEPIQLVLNRLQQDDGFTLVVNWDQLIPSGWNPTVTIPWKSSEATIEKTLRDLTLSMELAWRLLGDSTFEITSRKEYWNATRVEIYPCGQQIANRYTSMQIIGYLQKGIGGDLGMIESWTRVDYLPQYNCIVALLPDPMHIRVEKILNQLAERK